MIPDVTIRGANLQDASAIHALIAAYPDELLMRPINNIVENIDRFNVAILKGELIACAAWSILPELGNPLAASVELRSVAVRLDCRGHHIGEQLIHFILERVQTFKPKQALVLTFAPKFFAYMGFKRIDKTQVIHKIYQGCIYCTKYSDPFTCPEIAMVLDLTQK